MSLDAEDIAVLVQAAVYAIAFIGAMATLALGVGIAVRLFRLAAGL